jgi:pSer/pThr/pTyr-binding forkhead associated (FHA) protein
MTEAQFKLIKISTHRETLLTGDLLVGRQVENGLALTEGFPSRRHAQITMNGGGIWVEDLGSANGTFVNGARIAAKTQLKVGDKVRFDVEEFLLLGIGPNASEATVFRPADKPQEVVAEASGVYKRPGAWADPDADAGGANKTKFIDPQALKQMMTQAPKAETVVSSGPIDTPTLTIASGGNTGTRVKLQAGNSGATEWTVGSATEREVVLPDSGVSSLHAKIVNDGMRWKVIDQMSANGTYVNGKRSNVSFLTSGDRVRFGPVECEFLLPNASARHSARETSESSGGGSKTVVIAVIAFVVTAIVLFVAWKMIK